MRRVLAVALLLIVAGASAPMAVSAQSDDGGVLDGFLDDEDDGTDLSATVAGVVDKNVWQASQYLSLSDADEDQQAAEQDRHDLQQAFAANNESIESYANDRFDGNASEWDVIEIAHVRDEGNATHYLVADAENGSFENARMVNETDRDVDHTLTLEEYASDAAHAELDTFVTDYVATDRNVTTGYATRLAAEYSGYVERPEVFSDDE
ncbi:MAG: hypothetical protein ACOCQV_02860 [Halolamina sp.]